MLLSYEVLKPCEVLGTRAGDEVGERAARLG